MWSSDRPVRATYSPTTFLYSPSIAGEETAGFEYPSAAAAQPSVPWNRSPHDPPQYLFPRERIIFTPPAKCVTIPSPLLLLTYSYSTGAVLRQSSPAWAWANVWAPHSPMQLVWKS